MALAEERRESWRLFTVTTRPGGSRPMPAAADRGAVRRTLRFTLSAADSLGHDSFHRISGELRVARLFTTGLSGIGLGLTLGIAL